MFPIMSTIIIKYYSDHFIGTSQSHNVGVASHFIIIYFNDSKQIKFYNNLTG